MKTLIRAHLRRIRDELLDLLHTIRGEAFRAGRTRTQLRGRSGLRLNVGAGHLAREGYVNLDRFPAGKDVLYWDFRNPLPLADGSATHIHCEHFIEHLEHHEALALLHEFGRVLAPGGTLRLICPDAGLYLRAYVEGNAAFFRSLERLGGATRPMTQPIEIINQMFRMGFSHRHAWDQPSLHAALTGAGFGEIRTSSMGDSRLGGEMDGTDDWRLIESLYLWARRTA